MPKKKNAKVSYDQMQIVIWTQIIICNVSAILIH